MAEGGELIERRGRSSGDALRVVITDKGETRKPDRRSTATPPRASDAGARGSVRVTIVAETSADGVPVISVVGNAGDPAVAVHDFLEAIRSVRIGAR